SRKRETRIVTAGTSTLARTRTLLGRRPARETTALLAKARIPILVLVVLIASAVFAPLLAPYSPNAIDPLHAMAGPSREHLFGTDILGRDTLSRVLYGG